MSSDQVAYDEAYDLPRWQSQDTHSSRSLQYYDPSPPQQAQPPPPPPPQAVVVSGSSSNRRIAHLTDDSIPLGRSASLNAAARSQTLSQQDQAMSFYPSAVAYHSPDHAHSTHGGHDYAAPRRANTNVDPTRQRKQGSSSAARNSASYVPSVQLYPDPYQPQQQQPPPPASPGAATGSYYSQQAQQSQPSTASSGYAAAVDNVAAYPSHLTPGGGRGALSSPSTPHSYSNSPLQQQQQQQQQAAYFSNPDQQTPMTVEPPQQVATPQKLVGLKRVRDARDLRPYVNPQPRGRILDPSGIYLSPLRSLTTHLTQTYNQCNPGFRYEVVNNPRRVLTKPSKPSHNDGYDNEDYDYILYVNDLLGTEEGHKYLILDVLGQGTFGQVVKCQNIKTHEIVAVKVVKNKPAYFNQSMMEVTILELLNRQCDPHDEHHILRLRDSFIHRNHLCLVFELLSSNLYELIKQNSFGGLSTQLVKVFMTQLLDALTILKDARLIHCDLKPENILLKSLQSPQIKIIDFGSACHERQTVYTYIQSRFYRSPEVLLGIPYTAAIDMWSLGCIAVELFLGLPLFPGTSEYNQVTRIVEMLGMPPSAMLDTGKQTTQFFDTFTDQYSQKTYRLKSLETYSREHNTQEQPGKKYFNHNTLPEIIRAAPMPATRVKPHELEKEINNRTAFIDFCQCLLHLDPTQRWTPQQAKLHPFISGSGSLGSHSVSPRPSSNSSPAADPKRPYGGLVPMQPKGTRAYQDAASYNQQLAQHQAYTAQAQQAATQASNTFRNPYISGSSQATGSNGSVAAYAAPASGSYGGSAGSGSYGGSSGSAAYASGGTSGSYGGGSSTVYGGTAANAYSGGSSTAYASGSYGSPNAYNGSSARDDGQSQTAYSSSAGQYGTPSGGGTSSQRIPHQSSHTNLGLNTQVSHYPAGVASASGAVPSATAAAPGQLNPPSSAYYPRGRSNTITHDIVPPALARIANMSMDVPGIGRNALTPVMKREDAIQEWERRQNTGQQVGHVTYPQLEILQQQAEMLPQHWSHHSQQPSRYAAPPQSSGVYHDDRSGVREAVMSSVRTAAAGGTSSVASPPQVYTGSSSSRYASGGSSGYDTYDQPPRSAGGDMGAMYVPSQYQSSGTTGGGGGGSGAGGGYGAGAVSPAGGSAPRGGGVNAAGAGSFYGGGVVPLGQAGSSSQAGGQQRNPFGSVSGQGQGIKESRRNSGMDLWPR